MKPAVSPFEQYRQLETTWFENLSSTHLKIITDNGRVPVGELHLYGEIGFLLLGIKACVLIEHIPREDGLLDSYVEQVAMPWTKLLEAPNCGVADSNGRNIDITLYQVDRPLESPEISLENSWFIINKSHDLFPVLNQSLLNDDFLKLDEPHLALFLDYPGSLPNSPSELNTMLFVGYFDRKNGYSLTTYAAQERQKSSVLDHFQHYASRCKQLLNLDLELKIQELV